MLDFQQRRKLKTIIHSRLVRVLLVVVCIVLVRGAYHRYEIATDMEARRAVAEAEVAQLQAQKDALEKKVGYLSDERGIEAEMRRQFDVALKDEQVVVIVEPEKSATSTPLPPAPPKKKWYEFWR
jgi:cell division protein FtsB